VKLGCLLRVLCWRLILRVKGICEFTIDVNNLTGRGSLKLAFESACTTLNNCWTGVLGELHPYRFLSAGWASEHGWQFLLDNFGHPSSASAHHELLLIEKAVDYSVTLRLHIFTSHRLHLPLVSPCDITPIHVKSSTLGGLFCVIRERS
jgi:hypothetical protein